MYVTHDMHVMFVMRDIYDMYDKVLYDVAMRH